MDWQDRRLELTESKKVMDVVDERKGGRPETAAELWRARWHAVVAVRRGRSETILRAEGVYESFREAVGRSEPETVAR